SRRRRHTRSKRDWSSDVCSSDLTKTDNISFLTRRSRCDSCRNELSISDLIPVISFLKNAGRCRHCQFKISNSYLFVEILTIVLFVLPVIVPLSYDNLLLYYLLVSIIIPLSIYDYDTMLIPSHMLILLFISGLFLTRSEEHTSELQSRFDL